MAEKKKAYEVELANQMLKGIFEELASRKGMSRCRVKNPSDWKATDVFAASLAASADFYFGRFVVQLFEILDGLPGKTDVQRTYLSTMGAKMVIPASLSMTMVLQLLISHFDLREKEGSDSLNADLHYERMKGMVEEGYIARLEKMSHEMPSTLDRENMEPSIKVVEVRSMADLARVVAESMLDDPDVPEDVKEDLRTNLRRLDDEDKGNSGKPH